MKTIIFFLLFLFNITLYANVKDNAKIGISQFVVHPSLEKVRQGILDGLKKEGFVSGKNLTVNYKNANGNIVLSSQIAKQFASQDLDVAIAITTPSSQTLKNALKSSIPLVFSTVTDPVSAGLVEDLEKPKDNITGVTNPLMLESQFDYMMKISPDIKTVGVFINYSEDNSVGLLKKLKSIAKKRDIQILEGSVSNSSEVSLAIKSLVKKIDAIFLLQDNIVASAVNVINKVAASNDVPVFSTYVEAVEKGSLAGLAYDEYAIGFKTGIMAAKVINASTADGIPVESPIVVEKLINLKTANSLGIKINDKILNEAKLVS